MYSLARAALFSSLIPDYPFHPQTYQWMNHCVEQQRRKSVRTIFYIIILCTRYCNFILPIITQRENSVVDFQVYFIFRTI